MKINWFKTKFAAFTLVGILSLSLFFTMMTQNQKVNIFLRF